MKYDNKNAHLVGHSKLKTLDAEKKSKEKIIDDMQATLNVTIIEQLDSGRKKNPCLLQESEEQEFEETNYDADVTVEANKIDEDKN